MVMHVYVIGPGVYHGDGVILVPVLTVSPFPPLSSLLPPPRHAQPQEDTTGNHGQEDEDRAHGNDGDYVPGGHELVQDV